MRWRVNNRVAVAFLIAALVGFAGTTQTSNAQVLRMGGALHYGVLDMDRFDAGQIPSRLFLDLTGDLELIHRKPL